MVRRLMTTTDCPTCGFINSTVPATGPREKAFLSVARSVSANLPPLFKQRRRPPLEADVCIHGMEGQLLGRAERSTPNAAQRLRRRRKGLTAKARAER